MYTSKKEKRDAPHGAPLFFVNFSVIGLKNKRVF